MTLPSPGTKQYLDQSTDDPKLARAELADLVDGFNALLTHLGLSIITSTPLTVGTGLENNSGALQARAASTSQTGIAELATNAEAQAKSDTARVLTPSNLAALGSTDTFAGLVELATNTEALTGTDTARVVTPAGLKYVLDNASLLTSLSASLNADVALNNTGSYFDGPSIAQGTSGKWFVSGTVTLHNPSTGTIYDVKLWDGTTVIASTRATAFTSGFSNGFPVALSGEISSPAGNLRISVKDTTSTAGLIKSNFSGNGKDSTITAIKIGS